MLCTCARFFVQQVFVLAAIFGVMFMCGCCEVLLEACTYRNHNPSTDMQIMPSAHKVFVEKEQLSLDVIKQYRVDVNDVAQKDAILQEYILKNADRLGQTIIFVASRRTAQALYQVRYVDLCLQLHQYVVP
jgi:hypothetical protein